MISMPSPSHNSGHRGHRGDSQDFIDENTAQTERRTLSPRSELLSQNTGHGRVLQMHRPKRSRRRHERHRSDQALVRSGASSDELMRLLEDQEHETLRLRQALYTAIERIDTESQRVLAMEQENVEAMERFRMLNENRMVAQRDAMKAGQELRLYKFQLETAQTEIDRAQDALRRVQRQKEEAEEEAARARTQARLLHQERVIALAREEGRKDGFEAGFKRARREQSLVIRQRDLDQENSQRGHRKARSQPGNIEAAAYNRTQMEQAFQAGVPHDGAARIEDDQLSRISSPAGLPLRGLHDTSPEIIRIADPDPPPPRHHVQPHAELPQSRYDEPPPEPVPITFPHVAQGASHSPTPDIQIYSVDIPSTSQIQKEFPLNGNPGTNSQWVTAHQHLQMNGLNPSLDNLQQTNDVNGDLSRGINPAAQQAEPPKKRKESWYRTLSRRALAFRKKSASQNHPSIDPPATRSQPPGQGSWYTTPSNPPVHIRDYGLPPKARSSMDDTASLSTRMSQLDLVSPPTHTPNGSMSGRSGNPNNLGRKFREKNTGLFVINEDPLSRENTPMKEKFSTNGKGMSQGDARSQRSLQHQEPRYSNPKAVEAWRRSGTTSVHSKDMNSRPPNIHRRPVNLTMPAPLAPDNERNPIASRSRTISENNPPLSHSWGPDARTRNMHDLTVDAELSPPGISIVPPSQSPSETLHNSGHLGDGYLSPDQSRYSLPPSVRSAPPDATYSNSPNSSRKDLPAIPAPGTRKATSSRIRTPGDPNGHASGYRFPLNPNPVPMALQHDQMPLVASVPSESSHAGSRESFSRSPSYIPQPLPRGRSPDVREVGSYPNGQLRNGYNDRTPSMSQKNLTRMDGGHTLNRVASNTSMQSTKSKHSHYNPTTYLDPAYFSVPDGGPVGVRTASPGPPMTHSRAASTSSSLYFNPPG